VIAIYYRPVSASGEKYCLAGADGEHRTVCLTDDILDDAIPEAVHPSGSATSAEDDEVCFCGFGDL
jgi:hypothetical protein